MARDNAVTLAESAALTKFRAIATQGTPMETDRRPINMAPGDALVFRLDSFKVITDRVKKEHRYMGYLGEMIDGEPVILLESGNLSNFLGGVDSTQQTVGLQGRVIGVACVGEMDTGKQSPMKVFECVDFGTTWPTKPAAERRQRRAPAATQPADDNGNDDLPF